MKYIICNLKKSLAHNDVLEYISKLDKSEYKNYIICPDKEDIELFKNKNYIIGTQDYYDDITCKYTIIGHHDTKDSLNQIKEKIEKAISNKIKIILCIGNNKYDDLDDLKKQLDNIKKINYADIIIAYEPYFMINSNRKIDIKKVTEIKDFIYNYSNRKVIYGGNVNENNIEKILEIYDGVLLGRLSFEPDKFTKVLNKIKKNL